MYKLRMGNDDAIAYRGDVINVNDVKQNLYSARIIDDRN